MYCCGTLLPLSLLDKFERMSMKDLKNLVKPKVAPVIVAPGKVSGLLLLFFFRAQLDPPFTAHPCVGTTRF
jgi:hypothetical protein